MDLSALTVRLGVAITNPFVAILQHDSPLFLPFILSTLALAVVVFAVATRGHGFSFGDFFRTYFSRSVWGHRSAIADYKFYVVNGVLFPLIVGPLIFTGSLVARGLGNWLMSVFGDGHPGGEVGSGVLLGLTVAFFVAYDLGRYLGHTLQHEIPLLWKFHKIHHSAEVLTPFTNFRSHPVDLFIMAISVNLLTGLVTGIFVFFFAGKLQLITFFSLHILIFAYNLIGNLRHTHVWLSYGLRLGYLFISPAQHQIHHSVEPRHFGRNRGFAFAVWDWMFGTLYVPKQKEEFKMGLGDGTEPEYAGVWSMYSLPFRTLTKKEW